jgi:hypothetical protein
MEAIYSSETPVDFKRTTRRYIPEDGILHNHHCENLKSYKGNNVSDPNEGLRTVIHQEKSGTWYIINRTVLVEQYETVYYLAVEVPWYCGPNWAYCTSL